MNKAQELIVAIGSFFMANFVGLVLLAGLIVIDYGFYRISFTAGVFASGASLIILSVLLASEGGD